MKTICHLLAIGVYGGARAAGLELERQVHHETPAVATNDLHDVAESEKAASLFYDVGLTRREFRSLRKDPLVADRRSFTLESSKLPSVLDLIDGVYEASRHRALSTRESDF
jgi:hypothetical protein